MDTLLLHTGSLFLYLRLVNFVPGTTVDASEIRRSPVEVGSLSQYLQGFIMSYTSQVVQDFFHQRYQVSCLLKFEFSLLQRGEKDISPSVAGVIGSASFRQTN